MKAFCLFQSVILLSIFGPHLHSADVLDSSLVVRLNFDAEPINDAIPDISPAGGHPGANSGATWTASEDGRNGVMNFDGTVPSKIAIAPATDLNSPTGAITFWIKSILVTPDPNPYAMIFDRRETPGGGGDIIYQTTDGHLNTQAEATGRARANARVTTGTVTDGKWHHIAYVYDQRASGPVTLYVDGVSDNAGNNSRVWAWVATEELLLGTSHDPFWSGFSGFLDDFRIYNRVLTPAEVASVAGLAATPQIVINAGGQPQSLSVAEKDTPGFTVKATLVNGDPAQLHYQWQQDGTNIPNATNATYSLTATTADTGEKFRVQLSAPGAANVASQEATLTVIPEEVLIYNFDAAPVNDQIVDSSPSAVKHPGVNSGATWAASETGHNGVMSFDGTGPSEITILNAPELNSTRGTVAFWMKSDLVTPEPNPYAILFDRRETPGAGGDIIYQGPDGHLNNQAEDAGRAGVNAQSTTASLTDGKWHHIVYLFDQTAGGSVSLYVDGVLNTTQANSGAWAWPDRDIQLGISPDPFWSGFTGFLDEFRMYNRVLSSSEIAALAGLGSQSQIVITRQPSDLTAPVNDTPALSVSATIANGDPATLKYQWQKDGADIPNATNATYTLTVSTADSGKKFRAQLSALGATNATTAEVTLTVIPALTLIYSFDTAPVNDVIVDSSLDAVKHDGSNIGATWVASDSGHNGIMNFDGMIPSEITIPAAPELNSTRGTIAFWMKSPIVTPDPNPYAMILDRRETPGAGGDLLYQPPEGTVANQAEGAGRTRANEQATASSLTDNKWHHFAYTYDQNAAGSVSFYVDGVLSTSKPNTAPWAWPDRDIDIGKSQDTFWSGYTGLLDEFRIYNRVLSADEIMELSGGVAAQPTLAILRAGNQITLSWTGADFVLQSNSNLTNSSGWNDLPGSPQGPVSLTIPATGVTFYRLKK